MPPLPKKDQETAVHLNFQRLAKPELAHRFWLAVLVLMPLLVARVSFAQQSDGLATSASKTILFLGDSISVGSGTSSPEKKYPTVLTRLLNAETKDGEFAAVNLAIGGSTLVDQFWPAPESSGYPHMLAQAIEQAPDVLVIQHGTNDNALGHSLGRFLWTYRETVREIKKNLPNTRIVCSTICPSWKTLSATDEWVNQANAGIQEIAALENTLLAQNYLKLRHRRELLPDGIHPNDEGARVVA
ncbi:MAG: SGNH/GDSL hydrolase family protein [Bythopirellula sp.]